MREGKLGLFDFKKKQNGAKIGRPKAFLVGNNESALKKDTTGPQTMRVVRIESNRVQRVVMEGWVERG